MPVNGSKVFLHFKKLIIPEKITSILLGTENGKSREGVMGLVIDRDLRQFSI